MNNQLLLLSGGFLLLAASMMSDEERAEITGLFTENLTFKEFGETISKILVLPKKASVSIEDEAFAIAKKKLVRSEGDRNTVYKDSLGKLTVGIGHLVTSADNLKYGDTITDKRKNELFEADTKKAFNAALAQAEELGKYTPEFIAALTEVNFQLGTNWPSVFYETYPKLKNGDWQTAVNNLLSSKWNSQTPTRVSNFVGAIRQAFA